MEERYLKTGKIRSSGGIKEGFAITITRFGMITIPMSIWLSENMGSVKGAGTPWFPDVDKPGPGDSDPDDPIDTSTGYLGITVEVAPWIIWENEIDI